MMILIIRPLPQTLINSVILVFTAMVVWSSFPAFCGAGSSSGSCEIPGKCGQFGVCNSQKYPICTCLPKFAPRSNDEWYSGNWSGGCTRKVPLNCGGGTRNNRTKEDGFLRLQIVMLSGYSYRWSGPQAQCKTRCLSNCSCLAYGADGGNGCRFWTGPLIDIQKFPSGSGSIIYVRVSNSELDGKKVPSKILLILVVVSFVMVSVATYFSWKFIAKHRGKMKTIEVANASAYGPVDDKCLPYELSRFNLDELPLFTLEILINATDNFSEAKTLGKGGFGTVYKNAETAATLGELGGGREIAVKRLSKASTQGMNEFINEVVLISKLQHKNLVRLLGCCVENKETMLIYEYMPNNSLDYHLFDSSQESLDWSKRYNIIEGICRGLLYLHRDSRLKIIHRDLKPSNILLDNDWNPKISDFGMARIFGAKLDHVSTVRVVGTYGYMAPEYALEGKFSEKSDVYSFGVMMVEIATGRRNKGFHEKGSLNLLGHVWNLWNEENIASLIVARISSLSYRAQVMRCIHIGLLCVQRFPGDRPSISTVLSMLRSEISQLPDPKLPAFAIKSSHSEASTSSSQMSQTSNSCFTTVDGR